MELHEMANHVRTREELADFVSALLDDLRENGHEWENPTLERFLDAMSAWIRAMPATHRNLGRSAPTLPDWATLAQILYAARLYE